LKGCGIDGVGEGQGAGGSLLSLMTTTSKVYEDNVVFVESKALRGRSKQEYLRQVRKLGMRYPCHQGQSRAQLAWWVIAESVPKRTLSERIEERRAQIWNFDTFVSSPLRAYYWQPVMRAKGSHSRRSHPDKTSATSRLTSACWIFRRTQPVYHGGEGGFSHLTLDVGVRLQPNCPPNECQKPLPANKRFE
jgi:hypothetical protein